VHVLWVATRIALMQNAFAAGSLFAAAALLALSALLACLLSARHAVAVPPAEALRHQWHVSFDQNAAPYAGVTSGRVAHSDVTDHFHYK
jgi:hypothetical protein